MDNQYNPTDQYNRSPTNYSRASSTQPPFSSSNFHLKIDPNTSFYVNNAVIDSVVTDVKFEKIDFLPFSQIKKKLYEHRRFRSNN